MLEFKKRKNWNNFETFNQKSRSFGKMRINMNFCNLCSIGRFPTRMNFRKLQIFSIKKILKLRKKKKILISESWPFLWIQFQSGY